MRLVLENVLGRVAGRLRAAYPLRAHLIAFGLAILLPVAILAGMLLARAAALERSQLEARLTQVADELASAVDREIDRHFTALQTLAALPSLASEDWLAFFTQAKAALQGRAYVLVIDSSLHQLVNTYVDYGAAPASTGDPETAREMLENKQAEVSDLFVSRVSAALVFNVSIPILRGGKVHYILSLSKRAEDLVPILSGQRLEPAWTTTVLDRKGVLLARSRDHDRYVGASQPSFAADYRVVDHGVRMATSLDGGTVLRAVARSKLSGWLTTASIPIDIAEAPLRTSLRLWGVIAALALIFTAALAWLFARTIARPMSSVTDAIGALARDQPIPALHSSVTEANAVVAALQHASAELAERAAHQRMLLNELSHRVKNILAVVQSIAMRTLSEERSVREIRDLFTERLLALGRAHELLMRSDWKGAPIKDIIAAELEPFFARVHIDGPELIVDGKMVQTLALVLHELATNAAKHGALSNENGRVSITWSIDGAGPKARFHFRWEERDGPTVSPPTRQGFGSTLLASAIPADPGVKPRLAFEPGGFIYEIDSWLSVFVQS